MKKKNAHDWKQAANLYRAASSPAPILYMYEKRYVLEVY